MKHNLHFSTISKAFSVITLIAATLLLMPISASAAKSQTKRFTKQYKGDRLEVVLKDLCKHNGLKLVVLDTDIDLSKPITANFKDAATSVVLKKTLDSDCQGKIKKGTLFISHKPAPPVTYTIAGTTPTQVVDNDSINQQTFVDTVVTITCTSKTVQKAVAPQPKKVEEDTVPRAVRKEHNIQVLLGAGYSSLGYNLGDAGKQVGGFGGNAQFRYLYYFTDNWGIGLGVGFSNYGSKGTLNTDILFYNPSADIINDQTDSEGEGYGHLVRTHDWKESQQAYMVDVPIMVQCTYPLKNVTMKNGPLKVYADLGANLGFCVAANRQLKSGSIEHIGWYKPWHLELQQITGHDFYTEQAEVLGTDKQQLKFKMPAVGLMADFGFAMPLRKDLDLMLGVYANYTVNNICASEHSLGWQQDTYSGELAYRNHTFMEPYQGVIGSQFAEKVHPWQVGVRVGINFNMVKKEKPVAPEYERITTCDTTYAMQPRVETMVKPKPVVVVEKIKRVLEKSVIWFDLNSTEPKLQPADILDKVAEIMKENPEQKIMITGHASKEGNKELNQRLSEGRAQAIVDRLIELGVNPDQMQSQGLGVDVDYVEGTHDISLDRRAEITPILNKTEE
ncbi:MAG: OmpA family protein [Paludibacteraceae bacterium]|nr:OmpA family protein [Paludibacteraceae bacterium]